MSREVMKFIYQCDRHLGQCVVFDEQFYTKHPEAYNYETIGGNHSRLALTQLLKEKKELALDLKFFNRRVSVYTRPRLSDEQAQHLAHRHNRATEFKSKMNTQDKVLHMRNKLHVQAMYIVLCIIYTGGNVFSLA